MIGKQAGMGLVFMSCTCESNAKDLVILLVLQAIKKGGRTKEDP